GEGLTIVVNSQAGPALASDPAAELRSALPRAEVVAVDDADHLRAALDRAAEDARVVGAAGGDGTLNTAAAIALDAGKPLLVVPAGTLNHLARDLGATGVDDAVAAVRDGHAVEVDVGLLADRVFLNTASFGGYAEFVDARERLQPTIGKWPAAFVALVRMLRRGEPCRVEIDGRERNIWMIFVGNCRYHPSGFTPSWRERLDDGLLDVRIVDADQPWARLRLVASVLTGRLGRSRVYEQRTATRLEVRGLDGPLRLASDGETFDGPERFTIEKRPRALTVYVPWR
ncbi:MAG TPA: diacylglycerol kinase family protein, partial [Acidimicrobiales bacterium]|nr:diacylglycerol kinase family protein [Acidimicrobiales bacterium]